MPYDLSRPVEASKHAIHGYFECLRAEMVSKGITVTTISPGYVKTDLSVNALNGDGSSYGRLDETTASGMEPDDLAEIVSTAISNGESDCTVADAKTIVAIYLRTLFPSMFAYIMSKRAKKN